jgi:membrane-associated phospholipid phosphatase
MRPRIKFLKPRIVPNEPPVPFRPEAMALAALAVVIILAAWRFFDTIEDITSGDPLLLMDAQTYYGLQALRNSALDTLMITVTELGDTPVVVAIAVMVSVWLIHNRAWRAVRYWLLAIAGGSAINSAIKIAMQRARPGDLHYDGVSVFSFPSGHSTTNVVLYGFLAIMIMREVSPKWRVLVVVGAALMTGAIAFSRLYLGAHWWSDVIGGIGFGTLWLATLGFFYLLKRAEPIEPPRLLLMVLGTLVVAGGLNIAVNHANDMQRYAVKPHAQTREGLPIIPAPTVPFPIR